MTRRPHVVMVSWRDVAHPKSGGAERYTQVALEGLVHRGAEVTWLTSDAGPATDACRSRIAPVESYPAVRRGRGLVHLLEAARYLRRHAGSIDLVIDQINGYPMFTPLTFPGPRLVLVHQLAREVWFQHLSWPAAAAGWLAEPLLVAWYRRNPAITVSMDTARDLRRLGFRDVAIVRNAVQPPSADARVVRPRPPETPSFLAVGRLVPGKRFEHVIEAFEMVRRERPDAHLTIMGTGEGSYARMLERRCARTPGASLVRHAPERAKWHALAHSTALIATSTREGWGIVVSEAHAMGTPVVAYAVPGLRESVSHEEDGLVTAPRPAEAAAAMLRLAHDEDLWRRLSSRAREAAAKLAPARLQEEFGAVVDRVLRAHGKPGLELDPVRERTQP